MFGDGVEPFSIQFRLGDKDGRMGDMGDRQPHRAARRMDPLARGLRRRKRHATDDPGR